MFNAIFVLIGTDIRISMSVEDLSVESLYRGWPHFIWGREDNSVYGIWGHKALEPSKNYNGVNEFLRHAITRYTRTVNLFHRMAYNMNHIKWFISYCHYGLLQLIMYRNSSRTGWFWLAALCILRVWSSFLTQ